MIYLVSGADDQFSITAELTPVDTAATIISMASEPVNGRFAITVTFLRVCDRLRARGGPEATATGWRLRSGARRRQTAKKGAR